MKNIFIKNSVFILFLFLAVVISAQNLIPNPDFEKNINGKVCDWFQAFNGSHYTTRSYQENGKTYFNSFNGLCIENPDGSEYFVVKLNSKLIRNQIYCAQMDVKFGQLFSNEISSLNSIDWKFVTAPPIVKTWVKFYDKPDIIFRLNIDSLSSRFNTLNQKYIARGNEEYLVVGKFFNNKEDSVYHSQIEMEHFLLKQKNEKIKLMNDTMDKLYPSIPDYKKKKETEHYNKLVEIVLLEKKSFVESINNEYKFKIDSIKKAEDSFKFFVKVYFDNFCLSALDNNNHCICFDTTTNTDLIAGNTYRLNNVNFETGKSNLDSISKVELDNLYEILLQNTKFQIEIIGHTDNINTAVANLKLSQDRAKVCVEYLISKGIDLKRLSWKGFGSDKPLTENETEDGRKMNRRVEFIIK